MKVEEKEEKKEANNEWMKDISLNEGKGINEWINE